MPAKTSQLQIRVSPAQKAALKRLAEAADMSLSEYVLAQALPSPQRELTRIITALPGAGGGQRAALAELAELIRRTPPDDFEDTLSSPPLDGLSPVISNQVAALVEHAAHAVGVRAPEWVDAVAPLARPHFGWPLSSLRPHQLRVTPVPFKRRGIFFDPASPRAVPLAYPAVERRQDPAAPEPVRRLASLNDHLASLEAKVEFYLWGGAVLSQPFHASPATAHVTAQFKPMRVADDAVATLTDREGWPADWLHAAVKEYLVGGIRSDRYLELPNLALYVPPLDYLVALKVAALRMGSTPGLLDDLRYVLRAANVASRDEALAVARRYFTDRQIPADAPAILRKLLAA